MADELHDNARSNSCQRMSFLIILFLVSFSYSLSALTGYLYAHCEMARWMSSLMMREALPSKALSFLILARFSYSLLALTGHSPSETAKPKALSFLILVCFRNSLLPLTGHSPCETAKLISSLMMGEASPFIASCVRMTSTKGCKSS